MHSKLLTEYINCGLELRADIRAELKQIKRTLLLQQQQRQQESAKWQQEFAAQTDSLRQEVRHLTEVLQCGSVVSFLHSL